MKIIIKKTKNLEKDIKNLSNRINIDAIQNQFDYNILNDALTLKCIHIKECVRRLNTPINDKMGHLNDGLYIFFDLQSGLCRKKNNNDENNYSDHLCKGNYEYRKRCFYCFKKVIETQKVSKCVFCTKRYKI